MPATKHKHPRALQFSPASKNIDDMGHLLRRAGFGGTLAEIQQAAGGSIGTLIDRLVDYESVPDNFAPPPDAILSYRAKGMTYQELNGLSVWWLQRMLTSSRPLQEKMTLFWHGHFATAIQKVQSTLLMYQQNQLFRQQALGRFDDLLLAVARDPAMLIWLDGQRNTRVAPNENWGREMLELFALGHGNYTEDDVHANSRAFTGWRLDDTGHALFIPRLHDPGPKTLLGESGAWGAEDAVRIVAANPATGPFLADRLWRFFASDQAPRGVITKLAAVYYSSDHSIRAMVRSMLTMPEFYSASTRSGHIKSPAEFVVLTLRQLGLANADVTRIPALLRFLGQELFNPPNVGGWPGGPTWINASTLLGRFNFASSLVTIPRHGTPAVDTPSILLASGAESDDYHNASTGAAVIDDLVSYVGGMLGIALTPGTRKAMLGYVNGGPLDTARLEGKLRGLVHLALISPEYQAS